MLNLGLDVDINIKKVKMPFHFDRKNQCVHCGAQDSLVFIDKFGRESKAEINAFDHIKCSKCGRVYSIFWNKDEENGKMYPSAVNPSIARDFSNIVNNTIKFIGVKEFD
jgi:ribosomal protein L37E